MSIARALSIGLLSGITLSMVVVIALFKTNYIHLHKEMENQGEANTSYPRIPKPILSHTYGTLLHIKVKRTVGAGTFPVSFPSHDVLAINGMAAKAGTRIHISDSWTEDIHAEFECYGIEYVRPFGSPDEAPEGFRMFVLQNPLGYLHYFYVVAVKNGSTNKPFER